MGKRQSKLLILICLVILAIGVLFVLRSRGKGPESPFFGSGERSYSPPVAKADPSHETALDSPDGKWTLTMKEEKSKDGAVYTFWISGSDGSKKEILRKTVPSGTSMTIPYNTFSPDDKYIFLKEDSSGEALYLVLSVSGASLAKDTQALEISGLFADKYPDYKITNVTGWGGLTLIVVNTDKASGGQGPSFWFDVGSRSFIQLSNRFN